MIGFNKELFSKLIHRKSSKHMLCEQSSMWSSPICVVTMFPKDVIYLKVSEHTLFYFYVQKFTKWQRYLPSTFILRLVLTKAKSVALNITVPSLLRGIFIVTNLCNRGKIKGNVHLILTITWLILNMSFLWSCTLKKVSDHFWSA